MTVVLPAGAAGSTIRITDAKSTWALFNVTMTPSSGQKIQGLAIDESLVGDVSGAWVQFDWDSTNSAWVASGPGFSSISASSAVGEKNYISAGSSTASGWSASGAGITVATTSSGTPRPVTTATGILLTGVSGSSAYAYYRFILDDADAGKKLKFQFDMKPGTAVASDFKVDVYSNTASDYTTGNTRLSLTTDSSAVSALPALTGTYRTTFDAPAITAKWIEIRIGMNASATHTLVVSDVIVGPGTVVQGYAGTDWVSFTPTGSWSTNSTYTGEYRRLGADAQIRMRVAVSGAPNATGLSFNMPTGMTIDTARMLDTTTAIVEVGKGIGNSTGTPNKFSASVRYSSSTVLKIYADDTSGAYSRLGNQYDNTTPYTFANGDSVEIYFQVPIAEWAGSGTVNVVQNDVEYLYNTSTTDADDASSYGYGPGGGQFGSFTAARAKRVQTLTPISPTDQITLEISSDFGVTWISPSVQAVAQRYDRQNSVTYGMDLALIDSTHVQVQFGTYRLVPSASTFGAAGLAWSTIGAQANYVWRVKKVRGGQAIGFSEVNPGISSGLVSASGLKGVSAPTGSATSQVATGYVGEYREAMGSTTSMTSGQYTDGGSAGLLLTPGIYDLQAIGTFSKANTTTVTDFLLGIGTATGNNSTGIDANRNRFSLSGGTTNIMSGTVTGADPIFVTPLYRVVVTASTTYYPKAYALFATSTMSAVCNLFARRIA